MSVLVEKGSQLRVLSAVTNGQVPQNAKNFLTTSDCEEGFCAMSVAGWLVGWFVGWLVGWLVVWSVGRLVGWLVGRSVSPSLRESVPLLEINRIISE
jgi:hypothetical protein